MNWHERKKRKKKSSRLPLRKRMLLALIGRGRHVGLVIQLVINGTGGEREPTERGGRGKKKRIESPLEECGNLLRRLQRSCDAPISGFEGGRTKQIGGALPPPTNFPRHLGRGVVTSTGGERGGRNFVGRRTPTPPLDASSGGCDHGC